MWSTRVWRGGGEVEVVRSSVTRAAVEVVAVDEVLMKTEFKSG